MRSSDPLAVFDFYMEGKGEGKYGAERRGRFSPLQLGTLDLTVEKGEGQGGDPGLGRPGTT